MSDSNSSDPSAAQASSAASIRTEQLPSSTAVVTVGGELDIESAGYLQRKLNEAIADGAETVVVDLGTTTFIDSMALGVLLGAVRRLRERDGQLRIACADPNIKRILEITLLDRVFAIYPSRETALGRSAAAT